MIPALETTTHFLPLGRYACTLAELKQRYVDDQRFTGSTTRAGIYDNFLTTGQLLDAISPDLIEKVWVGGSFATGSADPDDIDCTFVISGPAFRALSNGQRAKVKTLNKKGQLREKTGLRVEPFVLVREPIANPWLRDGSVSPDALDYLSVRGAWDDWWMRVRTNPDKSAAPVLEDAEPIRGYLEVSWK